MTETELFIQAIKEGNKLKLARAITWVENEIAGYDNLLRRCRSNGTPVIGFTGPPGAGKSSLINALLHVWKEKKIAVLSVDPSSAFNHGALLGDRIRMNEHTMNENFFIRSVAGRGALGGLSPKTLEILQVLQQAPFDYILVETIGVGQSEIEIAGLADTTIVVMVPEAGDEIQTMKSGVMEIADIFVVNKADRSMADELIKNLKMMVHEKATDWEIPVIKTVATEHKGVEEIVQAIEHHHQYRKTLPDLKLELLTEQAYHLISHFRMKEISKTMLKNRIQQQWTDGEFNLYRLVEEYGMMKPLTDIE